MAIANLNFCYGNFKRPRSLTSRNRSHQAKPLTSQNGSHQLAELSPDAASHPLSTFLLTAGWQIIDVQLWFFTIKEE